jgi:diaminopimelate epimerase
LHHSLDLADGQTHAVHSVNTGVPHAVSFVESVDAVDLVPLGASLRYHEAFAPAGTNANFAEIIEAQTLKIRTYERGVEDETLACGTGMAACALLHAHLTGAVSPIAVQVAGGDTLSIGFTASGDTFTAVTLTGPADFVFEGSLTLPESSAHPTDPTAH